MPRAASMIAMGLAVCACGDGRGALDAGLDAGVRPPAPVVSSEVPPAVLAALPKTDAGLPILIMLPGAAPSGGTPALVYDPALDDPIARWGACLSRVGACYETNAPQPISGCVELIERCDDDSGGDDCCPPACIAGFQARVAAGADEWSAVKESFVRGGCLTGFPGWHGELP